jgi:phytoene dehydrogenase-like protein
MATPASDALIVGGGHNALVAAILLARAGRSVRVLERSSVVGGAAVSSRPFPGVDATLSRYSYLVSLLPSSLIRQLRIEVELRRRRVSSCTPDGDKALVIDTTEARTRRSFEEAVGSAAEYEHWLAWHRMVGRAAAQLAPTLTRPLISAAEARRLIGTDGWTVLAGQPLGVSLHQMFESDLVRGLVLTDGLIGTFAGSQEGSLRQNRCFLYHVVGNGHGRWDVPVGGMGTISDALALAATAAGAEIRTGAEVDRIETDGRSAEVSTECGERFRAAAVLCGAAPAVLGRLLRRPGPEAAPEGAQLKLNLLVSRLPRLASRVDPSDAFAGTLHVNERHSQLDAAFTQARAGVLPAPVPCEVYCHSLTDPSVLGPELRRSGAHAMSVFALHTPARVFGDSTEASAGPRRARAAALASLQSVLAEPLEDCLLAADDGSWCIEMHTPADLERDLAMPGGHIFHRDLQWPWAERDDEIGTWGVETDIANILLCGAGARRGGGVSGIPGHNAAMAALSFLSRR